MNNIKSAYKTLGKTSFYDGMITCSTFWGEAVCKLVWNMNKEKNDKYLELALSGIPKDFDGRLLEVPVGTGVLTMPVYKTLDRADITCLDYSAEMMNNAKVRAEYNNIKNVNFIQGDVGNLPFEDNSFDVMLSLNGFHAFPDKQTAYKETHRVLKKGGTFCGCLYIKGENKRTDWFIEKLYVPKGYFTPPFETRESLEKKLMELYTTVKTETVESMACFICEK
ncbi:MAG: methyltransferase domain-containing protein [Clostridia bacterium]|nr:methyltransferase domain-containing protein [Clostridia bacterium]